MEPPHETNHSGFPVPQGFPRYVHRKAVQVLGTELVKNANIASLQQGPETLDAVGVHHITNILTNTMVDSLMFKASHAMIGKRCISVDGGPWCSMVLDKAL